MWLWFVAFSVGVFGAAGEPFGALFFHCYSVRVNILLIVGFLLGFWRSYGYVFWSTLSFWA
jgi:hypothetical protein